MQLHERVGQAYTRRGVVIRVGRRVKCACARCGAVKQALVGSIPGKHAYMCPKCLPRFAMFCNLAGEPMDADTLHAFLHACP